MPFSVLKNIPRVFLLLLVFNFSAPIFASVIWTNPPSQPLTAKRIALLPGSQQPEWEKYLQNSERQKQADQKFLQKEMREHGITNSIVPPESRGVKSIPLDAREGWYRGAEARRIADIVISFQTPAGGWSKNLDLSKHVRTPGEQFAPDNNSVYLSNGDFDVAPAWDYVGTFDNDATISEMRFLAKVISENPADKNESYRASFLRGLDYIFAAQYPDGGWPQVWPLQGGYHDGVTFNDDAMCNILQLLQGIATNQDGFAFVPKNYREHAVQSLSRGIDCVLATQIIVNGQRTVWCQQYDPLTLKPTSARNYEMPSEASSESAKLMQFLMSLPEPDSNVVVAVDGAAAWFEKTAIRDRAFKYYKSEGRRLIAAPGKGPIWPRYCEIGTDQPIFGDRDKTIHDNLDDISKERRDGYAWFNDNPKRMLEHYRNWKKHLAKAKAHGV
ncbi:MAG TPA: pectate lyase [Verrucomicrobiae bacterium]|nr:pectate lyase [Verrucomicrobiae bacterium]